VVFGCAGATLAPDERRLFASADPLGFILFARNCRDPVQLRALVGELRDTVGRADAPVMIDQEGGRVARLGPPHWRPVPPAATFVALWAEDAELACEAAQLNARLMAADLVDVGVTVNCAPVLDLPVADADPIIGDRAHGTTPDQAAALGRAVCDGLLAGGILPVIKHIPGHGRAKADSHKTLPRVDAPHELLSRTDFAPFRSLADAPCAMTAHVVYTRLDADAPATLSRDVIERAIRGEIGFDGLLFSDDISMGALNGPLAGRVRAALAAGCDAVLHCTGVLAEMEEVAAATSALGPAASERLARALARVHVTEPCDRAQLAAALDALISGSKG
jgi:beta-N-acetylhexosaminidase